MSRPSLRVYFVEDATGLLTARLVARASTHREFVATATDEDQIFARLQQLIEREGQPEELLAPFSWTETLHVDKVLVEVRPQVAAGKRMVIGKQRIPIELHYAWAALSGEQRQGLPAGFRVMLPRFGFWLVLEDLAMAADVLRQAVSATLAGEAARSLFEYREVKREYVLEWSPRWRKRKASEDPSEAFPTVRAVAEDWSELARAGRLGAHYGPLDEQHLRSLLDGKAKPSLLLIGPSGVGKTAWVRALARLAGRVRERGARTLVFATSVDRIMAGQTYLGMWEQRCLDLISELRGEGHFLYLDRLTGLVRQQSGASSIADLLLPALNDGSLSVIAEATPDELERLQASHASLLACFLQVRIEPPSHDEVCALIVEHQERTSAQWQLAPDAVQRLVRHLELYRRSMSFPGKALRFLDWLERKVEQHQGPDAGSDGNAGRRRSVTPREVDRLFAEHCGLSETLISDSERATAVSIASALGRRVLGQAGACRQAAAVLARFKAGVSDPEKPIGSLLFVGPTGVGKTELAKELARYLFGSTERMVRIDMSEQMLSSSTTRLLSDERGAASLVQRVSQEPLSLVLLDEIEKAHPAVFDLMLGLLGEGRLTSTSGRLVDFRMTLIVMTSNLGGGVARVGFGSGVTDPKSALSAVRAHFRPELFNRLDHVIAFDSLDAASLRKIVDLLLVELSAREGLVRRNLSLQVSEDAKARLAELGWHPEYGARPLKRVLEERIMLPISVELARRPQTRDSRIAVVLSDGEPSVRFG